MESNFTDFNHSSNINDPNEIVEIDRMEKKDMNVELEDNTHHSSDVENDMNSETMTDRSTIQTDWNTSISLDAQVLNTEKLSGWMEYETSNGDIYYYNHDTGESQWENPYLQEISNHVTSTTTISAEEVFDRPPIDLGSYLDSDDNNPSKNVVDHSNTNIIMTESNVSIIPTHLITNSTMDSNLPVLLSPTTFSNQSTPSKSSMITTIIEISPSLQSSPGYAESLTSYQYSHNYHVVNSTPSVHSTPTSKLNQSTPGPTHFTLPSTHHLSTPSKRNTPPTPILSLSSTGAPSSTPLTAAWPMTSFYTPTSKTSSNYLNHHSINSTSFISTAPTNNNNNSNNNNLINSSNIDIYKRMSFSSMSDLSNDDDDDEEEDNDNYDDSNNNNEHKRSHFPQSSLSKKVQLNDNYTQSISSSDFSERHLKIWNKFFENAIKSKVLPKLKSRHISSKKMKKISNKKIMSDQKINKQIQSSPSRTPRSIWPSPMKDADYQELLEDFFEDLNHLQDSVWLTTIMMAAARKGDAISITKLLSFDHTLDITNITDELLRTPAHYCAKNDDSTCLAILFDNGANFEASDTDGRNPLHVCCLFGAYEALQFLLESAVQVNAVDKNLNTALHFAARGGYPRFCTLLLEYGAFIDSKNDQNQTPFDMAKQIDPRTEAAQEVMRILLSAQSPIQNSYITSPKHVNMMNNSIYIHEKIPRIDISSSSFSSSSSSSLLLLSQEEDSNHDMNNKDQLNHQMKSVHKNKDSSQSTELGREKYLLATYDYEENMNSQVSDNSRDQILRAKKKLQEVIHSTKNNSNDSLFNDYNTSDRNSSSSVESSRSRIEPVSKLVSGGLSRHNSGISSESPPPWFDLKIDTSIGKISSSNNNDNNDNNGKAIPRNTSKLLYSMNHSDTSLIGNHEMKSVVDDNLSDKEEEDEDLEYVDSHENSGILGSISDTIWGMTGILLDLSINMFKDSNSSGDTNTDILDRVRNHKYHKNNNKEDHHQQQQYQHQPSRFNITNSNTTTNNNSNININTNSNIITSNRLVDLNMHERNAPPTDHELRSLGLGFHPKPPSFVLAELTAGVEALKTGRTPKREYPIQPPPEVERVVNYMKAEADRISYHSTPIDIRDIAHNPFLLTPRNNQRYSENQPTTLYKESMPKPLSLNHGSSSSSNSAYSDSHVNTYSMGTTLPKGVSWRYVDVFSNPEVLKQT